MCFDYKSDFRRFFFTNIQVQASIYIAIVVEYTNVVLPVLMILVGMVIFVLQFVAVCGVVRVQKDYYGPRDLYEEKFIFYVV